MRIIKQLIGGATAGAVVLDAAFIIEEGKVSQDAEDHAIAAGVGAIMGLVVTAVVLFIGRR